MTQALIDRPSSSRGLKCSGGEDFGIPVVELDCSVGSCIPSDGSQSSDETSHRGSGRNLMKHSQRSLRSLVGSDSREGDIDGRRRMPKRSTGSLRNLLTKCASSKELAMQEAEEDRRNATFQVRSKSSAELKERTYSQMKNGSKTGRRQTQRSHSNNNLMGETRKSQRPEKRRTKSGNNLEKMRKSLHDEKLESQKPSSLRGLFKRKDSKTNLEAMDSKQLANMIMAEFASFED